ncbi:hypothetical protein BFN03_19785 [Rhodococcus sp. WMMA185]|nr:hypothetical protein BFN03_19785 [Rhodococcus sp. WMMA185]
MHEHWTESDMKIDGPGVCTVADGVEVAELIAPVLRLTGWPFRRCDTSGDGFRSSAIIPTIRL